jgi:hypothetical protein
MARTVAELSPGARIADCIRLGAIAKTSPLSVIGPALSNAGKASQAALGKPFKMRWGKLRRPVDGVRKEVLAHALTLNRKPLPPLLPPSRIYARQTPGKASGIWRILCLFGPHPALAERHWRQP